MSAPQLYLLDIEGTTTPISFVYDVLFPYARQRLASYVREHWSDPAMALDVAAFRAQAQADRAAGQAVVEIPEGPSQEVCEAVIASALKMMEEDRKVGALKSLQGRIWDEGYRQGLLQGAVFPDVAPALERWSNQGKRACIYSSGSVLAQKLLFGHSQAGDLTRFLSGYFDTAVGAKQVAESYREIARQLSLEPAQGLFCSDIVGEAQAASQAGWQVVVLDRPGNHPQPEHPFPVVKDFSEL